MFSDLKKIKASNIAADFPAGKWRRRFLLGAALWFFGCLLAGAPARLLPLLLKPLVPQLQLQNVDGGFWQGSAAQAFWLQDGKTIALGEFTWRLQPWSLLWLHPGAHISTSYGEQFIDTDVRVSPLGNVALHATTAALPVSLIGHWLPLPAKGTLAVKLNKTELAGGQLRALAGDIYWQQAQWQWNSQWLQLGDYRCALQLQGSGELRCALQGQGTVSGSGDVVVNLDKKLWSATLQLKLAATLPAEFQQMVTVMLAAQPNAQGQLQVQRNGKW